MVFGNLFLLMMFAMACADNVDPVDMSDEDIINLETEGIDYIALGDSYTIGEGVAVADRWPNQLSEKLSNNDIVIKETRIIARTGWTTRNLLDAIALEEFGASDDDKLVSLLIGVNNQYQNLDFQLFTTEFEMLMAKSIEIAGTADRVFVVSIPDYGVTPFGQAKKEQIARELDAYNLHMQQRCQELKIPFIDMTEISRYLGDGPDALAADQLHPSGVQYEQWVEKILPTVQNILTD